MDPLTDTAARVLTAAYLITMMFAMGLQLGGQPPEDKPAKRRKRRLLLRALLLNLVGLPLVALLVTRALRPPPEVASALLVLSACPGGRMAPHLARIAGADLGLTVETTLFLAKLTGFTAPLTLMLLMGLHRLDVHEVRLIASLVVLQLGPYLAGRWLRRRRPRLAQKLLRPVNIAALACAVLIFTFLVYHRELRSVLLLSPRGWLAVSLLGGLSLLLGWLAGGRSPEARRSIAITANARTLALALIIAAQAFAPAVSLTLFAVWLVLLCLDAVFSALARDTLRISKYPITKGV